SRSRSCLSPSTSRLRVWWASARRLCGGGENPGGDLRRTTRSRGRDGRVRCTVATPPRPHRPCQEGPRLESSREGDRGRRVGGTTPATPPAQPQQEASSKGRDQRLIGVPKEEEFAATATAARTPEGLLGCSVPARTSA